LIKYYDKKLDLLTNASI